MSYMSYYLDVLIGFIFMLFPIVFNLLYNYIDSVKKYKIGRKVFFLMTIFWSIINVLALYGHIELGIQSLLFIVPLVLVIVLEEFIFTFLALVIITTYYLFILNINYVPIIVFFYVNLGFSLLKNKIKLGIVAKVYFIFILNLIMIYFLVFYNNIDFITYKIISIILLIIIMQLLVFKILSIYRKIISQIKRNIDYERYENSVKISSQIAKITHEIKNPISVIKGYLEIIDLNDKDNSQKYIDIINNEVERSLKIMEDYLSIANLSLNEIDYLDLELLLDDIKSIVKFMLEKNNVRLNIYQPEFEPIIEGDYIRLKQVFLNIIKNSIEAIDVSGKIDIYFEENDDSICLYIEDNGIGMTEQTLDKVQELFYTTKTKGTGIGITLIKEIMKLHNGAVEYKSEYGQGTTVKLTFEKSDIT